MKEVSYIIVGFFPPELEQAFSEIRKKANLPSEIPVIQEDGKCNLIGKPHVTLKRTFYLNEGTRETEIADRLRGVKFNPVKMSSDSWKVIDTEHLGKIVLLEMGKSPELLELHTNLVDAVDDVSSAKNPEYERDNFMPHASVVYWAKQGDVSLLGELIDKVLPIECMLNEIYLFRKNLKVKEDPTGPDFRELVETYKAS
jgi:2'-5' RNA ligase